MFCALEHLLLVNGDLQDLKRAEKCLLATQLFYLSGYLRGGVWGRCLIFLKTNLHLKVENKILENLGNFPRILFFEPRDFTKISKDDVKCLQTQTNFLKLQLHIMRQGRGRMIN